MSTSSMADVCMDCVCAENCTLWQGRDEGQDAVAHAIMHAMCTPATNCIWSMHGYHSCFIWC